MSNNENQELKSNLDKAILPLTSLKSGDCVEIASQMYCLCIKIVNVCLVGNGAQSNDWVLIDAGMPNSIDAITEMVETKIGKNHKPKAIILTHGHFDHVGSVVELVEKWDIPVYAHSLEIPFLTGEEDYPQPDGTVEGGLVAKIAPWFPNEGIDLGRYIQVLPSDGTIPHMPGWRWIHTPGHTPGHISLFRERDGCLIAGDAFVTVRQDSLYKVLIQQKEVNGPPRYFTTNWQEAWDSVKKLEALKPKAVVTGHGVPMFGKELTDGLQHLATEFEQLAIPDYGKYV